MKTISWSHYELYGVSGAEFDEMIPFLQRRKDLAIAHHHALVHDTNTSAMDTEAYAKHQRHITAVGRAIDFNQDLIDDILRS